MGEVYNLFSSYYYVTHGKPVIVLKARDRFGRRKVFYINDFIPYFYGVTTGESNFHMYNGEPVKKIEVKLPGDVKQQRDLFAKTGEADIPFSQRYLIDAGITCGFKQEGKGFVPAKELDVEPRTLFIDIEVQAFEGVPDSKLAKEPVYTIGCYDSYKQDFIQFVAEGLDDTSQKELLLEFFDYVKKRDFDLISGWNVFFDIDYLISKAEAVHARYENKIGRVNRGERWIDIAGREVLDLLSAYKKFFQQTKFDSYALDFIYHKDFDKELLEYDYSTTGFDQIDWICECNKTHVMACSEINEHWNLIGLFDQIRRLNGCTYRQSLTANAYVDMSMLRRAHKKGFVLPTNVGRDEKKPDFGGGFVLEPPKGVFKNLAVLDFKKMYPSIIIGYNMSAETISKVPVENAYEVDGVCFKKEPAGIMPEMMVEFIERRNVVKKEMGKHEHGTPEFERLFAHQYALKQNVDSVYGVNALPAFRMYEPLISKSTTFVGRKFIKKAMEIVERNGYRVVYMDTDSVLFFVGNANSDDEARKLLMRVGVEMEGIVNVELEQMREELGLRYPIEVDFELGYGAIQFKQSSSSFKQSRRFSSKKKKEKVAKKRYAGRVIIEDKKEVDFIKIRGMETRRSDSAIVTREIQKELFRLILYGASRDEIKGFLRSQADRFRELPLEEFGIPRKMGMSIGEYSNPATVRSVTYANEYLGEDIKPSQRCYDVFVKRILKTEWPQKIEIVVKGKPKLYIVDRVSLTKEVPEGIIIDWDRQIRAIFRNKMEAILDSAGIEWSEVFEYHRAATLGEFGVE